MSAALQTRGIGVALGGTPVLHGIDVVLPAARWTSVVGPNGAGKSTLLKALAGLLPHSGEVRLMDRPLAQWRGRERARCLAWLGQGEAGADDLSVWDVAMLGRLPHQAWLAAPTEADRAAVEQAPPWSMLCAPPRPGTGANARWVLSRVVSASACCSRACWR